MVDDDSTNEVNTKKSVKERSPVERAAPKSKTDLEESLGVSHDVDTSPTEDSVATEVEPHEIKVLADNEKVVGSSLEVPTVTPARESSSSAVELIISNLEIQQQKTGRPVHGKIRPDKIDVSTLEQSHQRNRTRMPGKISPEKIDVSTLEQRYQQRKR